jgi:hypothetical protein
MLLLLLLAGAVASLPMPEHDTAQVIAISPLVGPEVDARERRLYHLFPGCPDFSSATFLRLPDSTYAVDMRTSRTPVAERLAVSHEQLLRIGRYIDDFEAIVPELASLPDGESLYHDLWAGLRCAPEPTLTTVRGGPSQPEWTDRLVNTITGAACGLGIGSAIGAAAAIEFTETRQDSVLRSTCGGEHYWYHYSIDYYELDRGRYATLAGSGTAAGGAAGWLVGRSSDRKRTAAAAARRGLAGYDFFGDPIAETDVQSRLSPPNRIGWTLLGATSGFAVGASVGLIMASVVRGIAFKPTAWDTIVIKNDGFSLDVPLIALSVAGLLRGAHLGYSHGLRLDWQHALADAKRERLRLRP